MRHLLNTNKKLLRQIPFRHSLASSTDRSTTRAIRNPSLLPTYEKTPNSFIKLTIHHTNDTPSPSSYHAIHCRHHSHTSSDSSSSSSASPPFMTSPPPRLYLHGPVGTGKSLLMDTFHTTTPLHPPSKRKRYHFHAFMSHIHSSIHQLKRHSLATTGRNFHVDTSPEHNPIIRVALALARDTTVLCLDECQVVDVADAMILRQLFEVLWGRGVVTVMTSNVAPEGLYEGGVNYGYFAPFVGLLRRYCVVYDVENGCDYRRRESRGDFFFSPNDRRRVLEWCREQQGRSSTVVIDLGGNRQLIVPRAIPALSMGWVAFEDLCERERGAGDYRRLAAQFRVLVLEDVPLLTLREHDRARRFITLIDELYEARCCLMLCVADGDDATRLIVHPDDLFADDKESGDDVEGKKEAVVDDVVEGVLLGVDVAQVRGLAVGELASVRELRFAFRRAASRLWEMCSRNWWNKDDAGRTILERLDNYDRL